MKKKRHYVSVVFKEALFGVKTRLLLTPKKPCLQHKEALFANRLNCRCKKILGKGMIFKILYNGFATELNTGGNFGTTVFQCRNT